MMQFQRIHRLTNESLFLVVFVATSSGQIQPRIDYNKLLYIPNVPELIGSKKYAFLNGTQRILGWKTEPFSAQNSLGAYIFKKVYFLFDSKM